MDRERMIYALFMIGILVYFLYQGVKNLRQEAQEQSLKIASKYIYALEQKYRRNESSIYYESCIYNRYGVVIGLNLNIGKLMFDK